MVGDLDLHFAALVSHLAERSSDDLQVAAALASQACSEGHVCLQLAEWSARSVTGDSGDTLYRFPSLDTWTESLRDSGVVGSPGDQAPLILDHQGRLYLQRYWRYERLLGDELLRLAADQLTVTRTEELSPLLDRLFPNQTREEIDWQRLAAVVTLFKRLVVISGGPGTGKTSTVVRILALLQQQAGEQPLSIALAAPTGKAAARLQASIEQAKEGLDVSAELLNRIPQRTLTLHRLLGSRPDTHRMRHDEDNPLPIDLLVIDEASMVDLAMMAKVVRALPQHARLILLGDRNQLASVEAGAVLGDICAREMEFSQSFCRRLDGLLSPQPEAKDGAVPALAESLVELKRSYRFSSQSPIGQLAEAIKQGAVGDIDKLFSSAGRQQLKRVSIDDDPLASMVTGYLGYLRVLREGGDAAQVFAEFERFRVLCVLRKGPQGLQVLNRLITQRLRAEGWLTGEDPWYPGRPVLITRNDHALHLYNGDVGIVMQDGGGRKQIWFQSAGGFRAVSPARLPEYEDAFAMTVHKSQGSEFDQVMLVMPEQDSPILTRELVYTGLTRCRERFQLFDPGGLLARAVTRTTRRRSGLRERLWGVENGAVCDPDPVSAG